MKAITTLTDTITRISAFYIDGFKGMRLGKTLWLLILVKLVVLFGVIKLLFFPNVLETSYNSDAERSNHLLEQLTRSNP
jgi:hypothetical protein